MGEVRHWPRLVGGAHDGTVVPEPDFREARIAMPEPDVPEGDRACAVYTELKLIVIPEELAVRFLVVADIDDVERYALVMRAFTEAAYRGVTMEEE